MIFISNPQKLESIFLELCKKYKYYKWCIAWAGQENNFPISKYLKEHDNKIVRMVVGLHFYQTHPQFIENYINNNNVRFIISSDGIFHPKTYLFYNSEKDWSVIIGSSNFTQHGLSKNIESNILITSKEDGEATFFNEINSFIEKNWDLASRFSTSDLDIYKEHFYKLRNKIKILKTITFNPKRRLTSSPILYWEWDDYANKVKSDEYLKSRIEVLNYAQKLFEKYKDFGLMEYENRRKLAGFQEYKEGELDWKLFGSMKGAGYYKMAVKNMSKAISAINNIPLFGNIDKASFKQYIKAYKQEFHQNTLACATRLLAMKRPDVFICVDNKNKKQLCLSLGITQNSLTLDSYWELVIEPIMNSAWYNISENDIISSDKDIYKYRVALLDSAFYSY